jgi:hypothetical protein
MKLLPAANCIKQHRNVIKASTKANDADKLNLIGEKSWREARSVDDVRRSSYCDGMDWRVLKLKKNLKAFKKLEKSLLNTLETEAAVFINVNLVP